jgi:hypothetical protein
MPISIRQRSIQAEIFANSTVVLISASESPSDNQFVSFAFANFS